MDRSIARWTFAVIVSACSLAVFCTTVDDAHCLNPPTAQDGSGAAQPSSSIHGAYEYLDRRSNASGADSTARFAFGYSGRLCAPYSAVTFTYRNALATRAYFAQGDIHRGSGLHHAHDYAPATNFTVNDGRLARANYVCAPDFAGAFSTAAASFFHFYASAIDDRAWAQLALARLQNRTNSAV